MSAIIYLPSRDQQLRLVLARTIRVDIFLESLDQFADDVRGGGGHGLILPEGTWINHWKEKIDFPKTISKTETATAR